MASTSLCSSIARQKYDRERCTVVYSYNGRRANILSSVAVVDVVRSPTLAPATCRWRSRRHRSCCCCCWWWWCPGSWHRPMNWLPIGMWCISSPSSLTHIRSLSQLRRKQLDCNSGVIHNTVDIFQYAESLASPLSYSAVLPFPQKSVRKECRCFVAFKISKQYGITSEAHIFCQTPGLLAFIEKERSCGPNLRVER